MLFNRSQQGVCNGGEAVVFSQQGAAAFWGHSAAAVSTGQINGHHYEANIVRLSLCVIGEVRCES